LECVVTVSGAWTVASIRQVAQRAGTSVATVSRALNGHAQVNEETRRRVLDAAARMGYKAAVGKRSTTVIGLAYPGDMARSSRRCWRGCCGV